MRKSYTRFTTRYSITADWILGESEMEVDMLSNEFFTLNIETSA